MSGGAAPGPAAAAAPSVASVSVAVVDSGANVPHPHLPAVAGGTAFDTRGTEGGDWIDRLGHGTAVAAAIHEKAPAAELWAVKVFDDVLATTAAVLARALDWASERGVRVVNLSLGTENESRAAELAPAIARALERGTLVVSPRAHRGRLWYPGCMEGVVGVLLDPERPRDTVSVESLAEGGRAVAASGFPRPIPGVPPERNLNGISFAAANATGVLARLLAARPDVRSAEEALDALDALSAKP